MKSTPPNIIFIITDQQRADTVGAWGNEHMVTPNLDRLSRQGRSFRRAYCPGATCVASRAAIFTGRYAHNTGVNSFYSWGHQRNWVQDLSDGGYYCASIGKMHFDPRDARGGFHDRIVVENPTTTTYGGGYGDDAWGKFLNLNGYQRPNNRQESDPDWARKLQWVPWHLPEHLHSDVFIGSSAVAWVENHKSEKPLFLQIGFTGPHEPWDPLPRHLDLYRDKPIPAPVTRPDELDEKPPQQKANQTFFANSPAEGRIGMDRATPENIERMRRHYYAKTTLVDEQIGRVLDALEMKGLLENALVVVTSDHGELLGDHQLPYKWLMYEPVVNVPLIISGSNVKPGVEEALVSLIDLGPTFLEAAGLPVPTRLEGGSLLENLTRGESIDRRFVFCEDNFLIMMRSETHKLVYYIGGEEGEFYDLQRDPHELFNRWADSDYNSERAAMCLELLSWITRSTYYQSGHHCREVDQYCRRWPSNKASLQGPTALPKQEKFL